LLGSVKDMNEMRAEFVKSGRKIAGNSDSGNTLFIDSIKKEFPQAKIVVIKRNREETIESMANFDIGFDYDKGQISETIDLFMEGIKHLENDFDCLCCDFADLTKAEHCKKIFEYCTGLTFDHKRWELLNRLNMQVDKKYAKEQIEHLSKNGEIFGLINN